MSAVDQIERPLLLSATALGELGRFIDGPSPFARPPLDPTPSTREALASLLARGLVVQAEEGLVLGEELGRIAQVALAAEVVVVAEAVGPAGGRSVAWLVGPAQVLEQAWQPPTGFALRVLERSAFADRASAWWPSSALSPGDACEPGEVTVDAVQLATALQGAQGSEAPAVELPELAAAFVQAIVGGAERCSLDRRTRATADGYEGVRLDWIDAGPQGCWLVDRNGELATVRRLPASELSVSVAELLTPTRSAP